MLAEELRRVDDAIAAPTRPFVRNFEVDTEQEKVREANKKQSSKAPSAPANNSPKNERPSQAAAAENINSPQRAAAAPQQDSRQ